MKPVLKVTGRGRLSLVPDMIRIRLEQLDTDPDYSKVIRESTAHTEELRTELTALGFDEKALKTLNFTVDTEYEGYQDSDMTWKQRFKGYNVRHSMKLEFSRDDGRLAKVLFRISCLSGKPEFHIEYTVRDTEEAKKDLLGKAVQDAREKAEILAGLVRDVWPALEKGVFAPHIHAVLPITGAAEAHLLLQEGKNRGKVVLAIPA